MRCADFSFFDGSFLKQIAERALIPMTCTVIFVAMTSATPRVTPPPKGVVRVCVRVCYSSISSISRRSCCCFHILVDLVTVVVNEI